MIHLAHCATCVERAIIVFLLFSCQTIDTEYIMETVKDNIMIESWVTVLERMLRIPTRGFIEHILAILYKIDGFTV